MSRTLINKSKELFEIYGALSCSFLQKRLQITYEMAQEILKEIANGYE